MPYKNIEDRRERDRRYRANHPERVKESQRKYKEAYPERNKSSQAKWRAKNADTRKIYAKNYRDSNPERWKAIRRKSKYKVLPSRKCPTHCESCGVPFTTNRSSMACFDHDHRTGAFRGWLCHRCNRGLGALGDCREGVQRMLNYLQMVEMLS